MGYTGIHVISWFKVRNFILAFLVYLRVGAFGRTEINFYVNAVALSLDSWRMLGSMNAVWF